MQNDDPGPGGSVLSDGLGPMYLGDGRQAFLAATVAGWAEHNRRAMTVHLFTAEQVAFIGAAERERCGQVYGSREVAMTAEIERLRAALTLAANRMDVLALDHDYGTTRRNITDDWAKETRAALGPNVEINRQACTAGPEQ